MSDYTTTSKSNTVSDVSDIVIRDGDRTRLIMRCSLVKNEKEPNASLRAKLLFQKKKISDEWVDFETLSLTSVKAGEGVQMNLRSGEVLKLYTELSSLYKIFQEKGLSWGQHEYTVTNVGEAIKETPTRVEILKQLIEKGHSDEFLKKISELKPGEVENFSHLAILKKRQDAVKYFEDNINNEGMKETDWQKFFAENEWIFGFNLNYVYLEHTGREADCGGTDFTGKGAQKTDFLGNSAGETSFTTLIEIKTPLTKLLNKKYRNGTFPPSLELSGGTAQIQINCRAWEITSRTDENREKLESASNIYTVQPKGLLIIGNTDQLDETAKRTSFQTYRRNIHNPEVITFDELLQRAKYLTSNERNS